MNNHCLVYNNSLKSPLDFIDSILYSSLKAKLPTFDFEETREFYYIDVNSFNDDKHLLEISYKFNFFILTIKSNNDFNKTLLQRMFYLPEIDLNHILLHEFHDSMKFIIPKKFNIHF